MRTLFMALAVALLAPSALAQGPCEGRITDQLAHPLDPAALAKPAPGECYADPVFGSKICRITDVDPAEGTNAIIKTNYNTTRGWNADGSLLFLWHRGGGRKYEIYDGEEPYAHRMTLNITGGPDNGVPSDIEHLLWDPFDPAVLYYPNNYRYSGSPAPRLYKVTLDVAAQTATHEIVRSFETAPTNCPVEYALHLGHIHDMAISANRMVGFSCGSATNRIQFLYSITEDRVYGQQLSATPTNSDAPVAFQSGTGAYFQWTGAVTDNDFNLIRTLNFDKLLEHQALGLAAGRDTLNRVTFDAPPEVGSLVSVDLRTGASSLIIGPGNGWPYPPSGTHVSLTAADGSGWVAVGSFGTGTGATTLDNEIYLGNVVTGEVCRVAHARTKARQGTWGYWAETHPQISADGHRILFTSDWLDSDTVDTYVVDLRSDGPPPPPPITYRSELGWLYEPGAADGFHIERAPTIAGPFARIATVGAEARSYVDRPILPGATWCWRLVAFNVGGESPGPAACATADAPEPPPAPPAPVVVVELE